MKDAGRPCAFHVEGSGCISYLDVHNLNVARLLSALFSRRLKTKTLFNRMLDEATGVKWALFKASIIAALAHDIGKASLLYQPKGPYRMHEHVSAILLLEAAGVLGFNLDEANSEGGPGLLYMLAAAVVGRHHAAMKGRHPLEVGTERERSSIYTIVRALKNLDPGFIEAGIDSRMPGWFRDVLVEAAIKAGKQARMNGVAYVHDKIPLYASPGNGSEQLEGILKPSVQAGSGALIVSDILAAYTERRNDHPKGYVSYWIRELGAGDVLGNLASSEWMLGEIRYVLEDVRI